MARSKIKGMMGTDNYIMSDCPFHLPKENLNFFHYMQDEASKDAFDNFTQYGNAYVHKK